MNPPAEARHISTGPPYPPYLSPVEPHRATTADHSQAHASSPVPTTYRASTASRNLNPRSCHTCRRRKVKCDKQDGGCGNCAKAHIECVYPGPGRAPRRLKSGAVKGASERETELLKRLKKLEGVVEELSGQVEVENIRTTPDSSKDSISGSDTGPLKKKVGNVVRVIGIDEGGNTTKSWTERMFSMGHGPPRSETIETEMGKLLLDEGKSHYVSNSFWARFHGEVENIRELFAENDAMSEDEDEEESSPDISGSTLVSADIPDHHSFVMGYSSSQVDLRSLHPLPSQIPFYWEMFKENVDPLCKLLHIPTMTKTMKEVKANLGSLSRSTEALCFAIYFATITSMSPDDVKTNFAVERTFLLNRYRFATEQALARAGFLQASELVTVQAFVLFLVCVRRSDESKFVWTLTGLAIRIAQSLGLHRDGTNFNLSPFDTEMRRRCWWQICVLDIRSSEDYGSDPSILEFSYDTQFPMNINDEDIDPGSAEPPQERIGLSEQTFCMIRYEICHTSRKLIYVPPGAGPCRRAATTRTLAEKEDIVKGLQHRLETKYLTYCEDAGPLYWVAATVGRLVLAKMGLIIYSPHLSEGLPQSVKDRLFIASIEIMEYSLLLETETSTRKWGWLFHTYIQWHAIAYILGEVCARPRSPLVDRGWSAVDKVFDDWDDAVRHSKSGMLWAPMRKLMAKARRKREGDMRMDEMNAPHEHHSLDAASPNPSEPFDATNTRVPPPLTPSREEKSAGQDYTSSAQPDAQTVGQYQMPASGIPDMAMDGLESGQMQTQFQPQNGQAQTRPWILDDSALDDLDMTAIDGDMSLGGWNDVISYFHMDAYPNAPDARGAGYNGINGIGYFI